VSLRQNLVADPSKVMSLATQSVDPSQSPSLHALAHVCSQKDSLGVRCSQ
jgi:hypothetical protein